MPVSVRSVYHFKPALMYGPAPWAAVTGGAGVGSTVGQTLHYEYQVVFGFGGGVEAWKSL